MAGGEEHVWNIVKVDGKWYNIDLTWDDPILDNGESMISYDFFLKNNEDFYDHLRAPEYSTEEFLLAHEISGESYILK
jgi:transglutaminase/protease-like cytokinesis protein 3